MLKKKIIVLSVLVIMFFQITAPFFNKSYATEESFEENVEIKENMVNDEQILENIEFEEEIVIIDNDKLESKIEDKEENQEEIIEECEEETTKECEDKITEKYEEEITEEFEEEIIEENKEEMENCGIMLLSAGDVFVGNETEFRNALAIGADVIHVRQSINFNSPIYINYPVKVIDESDDNALRYGNGGSFITVQNGGALTLDGMVVDLNSSGNSGMVAINIESGGTVTFINSSIVDGGLGNTGILVNGGSKLLLWSSNIVRCGIGINLQTNGNLEFATQAGRINDFYWNNTAVYVDNFYGTCNFNQNITMHDNNEYGIYVVNSNGNINISTGDYYNNKYAIRTANGTANISGGSYHANGWALWCGGNITLTGGDIYGNYYGVITDSSYNGNFVMTGGNIYDNSTHAIQHQKINDGGCTVLGGNISGDIYLATNDNYVNTNSETPKFTVTPSTYFFKRKLVRTTNNEMARSEINNVNLTPKDYWYKNIFNEYIVLWKDGNISIKCIDKDFSNVPIVGAKFDISDENGNIIQTVITDTNGNAISKNLPAGYNYVITQKATINNYTINTKKEKAVFIDEVYFATYTNEHDKGNLSIVKMDKDFNDKTLSGVKFNLYSNKLDRPYKSGDLIGTYITDENGRIVVNNVWTGSYYFVEMETLKTYNLDTTKNEVIINKNETTNKNIENEKKKDKIEIFLKDDDTDIPLDNIEFDIIDKDGNVLDSIKTDEKGHTISKELPIDDEYTVIQKNYKDNYIEENEEIKVDFIKEFGYEGEKVFVVNIKNKHKKGNLKLNKVDFDNEQIRLEGFKFELYVKDVDNPYKSGDLIGTYTTDENGVIDINDLWIGKYYFVELESEASVTYQLIDNDIDIEINTDKTTEFNVANEKKKGKIEISKKISADDSTITDNKKGTLLEGAKFEILDSNNNIVDTIVTDKNGYAISKGLPIDNSYKIREVEAPEYYLINEKEEKIEFSENGEVKSFDWADDSVKLDVKVEQNGIIETQVNDLIKYDITCLKNNSNVDLEDFGFEENIPYEYVELKSFYTGTYNYEHEYEIWYKTKENTKWQIIENKNAENGKYSTLKENYIDFSFEKEQITDIKILFGKVESDFSGIDKNMPFIFVKVLDTAKNNDKWNNIVSLSGKYISNKNNEVDVSDSSEFETKCYSKKLEYDDSNKGKKKVNNDGINEINGVKRSILPRTGK